MRYHVQELNVVTDTYESLAAFRNRLDAERYIIDHRSKELRLVSTDVETPVRALLQRQINAARHLDPSPRSG